MRYISSFRKEDKKVVLKYKDNIINKKIINDIKCAKRDRLNGDMGTPVEEVLLNMKKIMKGENIFDNQNFNF